MPLRRLDRDQIVAAALALSKDADVDAVSFRKIGAELGADPTAVYRYFKKKSDLVAAALDELWIDTVRLIPDGLEWRPRLERIAHEFYVAVLEHPAIGVEACHQTTEGPGEFAAIDLVLGALVESGLSPDDVARFYPVFSGTVLSMASAQAAYELAHHVVSPATSRAWLAAHLTPDPDRFPSVHQYAADLERFSHRDVFDLSLEVVLDAIEVNGEASRDTQVRELSGHTGRRRSR